MTNNNNKNKNLCLLKGWNNLMIAVYLEICFQETCRTTADEFNLYDRKLFCESFLWLSGLVNIYSKIDPTIHQRWGREPDRHLLLEETPLGMFVGKKIDINSCYDYKNTYSTILPQILKRSAWILEFVLFRFNCWDNGIYHKMWRIPL